MSPLIELRARVQRVRQANEALARNMSRMLAYERQEAASIVSLHTVLRDLVVSVQESRAAMDALCVLLAVEPENLDGPLDALVPPLLEGTTT